MSFRLFGLTGRLLDQRRPIALVASCGSLLFLTSGLHAWVPGPADPNAIGDSTTPLAVDTTDRNDVLSFYHCIYEASEDYKAKMNWTGSVAGCTSGTTAASFKDDVRRRINFYRALAGVPGDIEFNAARNANAQAAALIMSEHSDLSHNPSTDFGTGGCWTAAGQEGADKGNLAVGSFGVGSIDGYMEDPGTGNTPVGHRRWLLNPPQTTMGTGDIPSGGQTASNCIYVGGSSTYRAVDPVEGSYYSWPPAGFTPSTVVWPRWSLHFSSAVFGSPTFGSASVSMKRVSDNSAVPVTVVYRYLGGAVAADPTIVWEPNWAAFGGAPPHEVDFEVTVSGVTPGGSGAPASYTYRVTVINQETVTDAYSLIGSASPPVSGSTYTIAGLSGVGADQYEVEVTSLDTTAWLEGAEDSPSPRVVDETDPSYDLLAAVTPAFGSPGARTGSKAFHLAFPDFVDQSFQIDRDIVLTATSTLDFWNQFRATNQGVNRLTAEISTDGGGSWTEIWARSAGGLSSNDWDKNWIAASVNLAAYAGEIAKFRFVFYRGGPAVISTLLTAGCFIDDLQVTDSTYVPPGMVTNVGAATSFTLNAATAGSALVDGQTYWLRVRPILGCKTFAWSDPLVATATSSATGYAAWSFASTVGGATLDYDLDGLLNGFEYAFGLDPTDPSDAGAVPQPTMPATNQLHLTMSEPPGISGVIYGAQWSLDLQNWFPLTDSGGGAVHTFLAANPAPHLFVRWTVLVN